MCTSIAYRDGGVFFGRNMDLDYHFDGRISVTPRNFPLIFRDFSALDEHYGFIGMTARINGGFPLYCEGMNEKGLYMAGLDFVGNAHYPSGTTAGVAPFELIPLILGECASVDEARCVLSGVTLSDTPYSEEVSLTPLHWHIADREKSIVVEPLADGIKIYNNPADVLTNNPPFDFQMNNLCMYMNLTPTEPLGKLAKKPWLTTFGKGLGSFGLPGDFSPPSRFVRAVYMLSSSQTEEGTSHISQVFRILDNIAMVRGSVLTASGKCNFTDYSCCFSPADMACYIKTYGNGRLSAAAMTEEMLRGDEIRHFEIPRQEDIFRLA